MPNQIITSDADSQYNNFVGICYGINGTIVHYDTTYTFSTRRLYMFNNLCSGNKIICRVYNKDSGLTAHGSFSGYKYMRKKKVLYAKQVVLVIKKI